MENANKCGQWLEILIFEGDSLEVFTVYIYY